MTSKVLETENWRDAVKAAHVQGAFIFWNHPGWEGQQPDRVVIQVRNDSDLRFELRGKNQFDEMTVSEQVVIPGAKTALLTLQAKPNIPAGQKRFQLSYVVENLKIDPEQGLPVTFDIDVTFVAPGR